MKREIILASQSPRRKELLARHGIAFEVFVTDADETVTGQMTPPELVEELSYRKAKSAAEHFSGRETLIVAADTVVALEQEIFGKPADSQDACRMLSALSGRAHSVFTGVTFYFNTAIFNHCYIASNALTHNILPFFLFVY